MFKKKILVIDDSPTTVSILKSELEEHGYEVISAGDGSSGLVLMRQKHPDLAILDVNMPGLQGLETCRIAKADFQLKDIPVVFLTVAGRKEDIEKGTKSGADAYVVKPYVLKDLLEVIEKLTGGTI